eukprot:766393-Hanusia_phi.AAC.23
MLHPDVREHPTLVDGIPDDFGRDVGLGGVPPKLPDGIQHSIIRQKKRVRNEHPDNSSNTFSVNITTPEFARAEQCRQEAWSLKQEDIVLKRGFDAAKRYEKLLRYSQNPLLTDEMKKIYQTMMETCKEQMMMFSTRQERQNLQADSDPASQSPPAPHGGTL